MPQALDPNTFFETLLPSVLQDRAKQAALPKLVATFQVVGENGGTWTLRCDRSLGKVLKEDAEDAQIRFIVGDRTLLDILAGSLDAQTALTSRAMTIQGDWSLLTQLAFLFALPKSTWQRF